MAEYAGYNTVISNSQKPNGTPISPAGGYTKGILAPNGAIAVDGAGTVWLLNEGNFAAAEMNSSTGSYIQTDFGYLVNPTTGTLIMPLESIFNSQDFGISMAIDNAGDVFIPNPSTSGQVQIYELPAGGNAATDGGTGLLLSQSIPPVYAPIAIDGSGHLWLVTLLDPNNGNPASLVELTSSGAPLTSSLSAPGLVGPSISDGPAALAVDGSGNVWVLIGVGSSTVTEYIGVASPVVTPLALGTATKSLGKRP